jgi:hypothetical protein
MPVILFIGIEMGDTIVHRLYAIIRLVTGIAPVMFFTAILLSILIFKRVIARPVCITADKPSPVEIFRRGKSGRLQDEEFID